MPSTGEPHWYDVAAFEEHLRLARRAPEIPEALFHLRAAVALYRGDYLSGWNAEWALDLRERLRTRYLEALMALAEGTWKAGEPQAALAWFLQALHVEPTLEAACLGALRCYMDLGQPGAALALYRQYAARLERELGLRPSPEAQALYEALRRAQSQARSPGVFCRLPRNPPAGRTDRPCRKEGGPTVPLHARPRGLPLTLPFSPDRTLE